MNFLTALLFASMTILSSFATASEVDSFSNRDYILNNLPDATAIINRIVNDRLALAVTASNKKGSCQKRELEKQVLRYISGKAVPMVSAGKVVLVQGWFGYLEELLETGKDKEGRYQVPVHKQTKKNSIYSELGLFESLPIAKILGSVVHIGEFVIGSDKLGHFMGQGHDYYKQGSIEKALKRGDLLERGILGLNATGVYSYGDLAANFAGMTFYRELLETDDSYVVCSDGRFELNPERPFRIEYYVTAAWDEGINCSTYATEHMATAITQKLDLISNQQGTELHCPINQGQCDEAFSVLSERHGRVVAEAVVSPLCRSEKSPIHRN